MIFKALTFSGNLVSEFVQKKGEMVWELQHIEIWMRKIGQQKELRGSGQRVRRKTMSPVKTTLCLDCTQPIMGTVGMPM